VHFSSLPCAKEAVRTSSVNSHRPVVQHQAAQKVGEIFVSTAMNATRAARLDGITFALA
jgi:hypothetical protein